MIENDDGNSVPLEEVLIAFKKSLARATLATERASKYDVQFLLGNRTLYNVGGLHLNLNVGMEIENQEGNHNDRILLDFSQDLHPEKRSNLQFQVDATPVEPIKGPKVVLARRNKVGAQEQGNEFKVWVVGNQGEPRSKDPINIHIESSSFLRNERPESIIITDYQTDLQGQLKFEIDFKKSELMINEQGFKLKGDAILEDGTKESKTTSKILELSSKKEWFIWITQNDMEEPSEILSLIDPDKKTSEPSNTSQPQKNKA